jgi:hypothetical protein
VYVVVLDTLAVGFATLVLLNPVEGDHVMILLLEHPPVIVLLS